MEPITINAYSRAERFLGIKEIEGDLHHPLIQWWLSLCTGFDEQSSDEIPWCSAFVNGIAWDLRLPRSRSAMARSWLSIGRVVPSLLEAAIGFDVVILQRGSGDQPGPDVLDAPGHVGFYAGRESRGRVHLLGGNQGNRVSVGSYDSDRILGIRRLRG